jgi:hypothetical protein
MIADAIAQIGRLQAEHDRSAGFVLDRIATHWLMVRLSSFGVEAPDIGVSVMTTPHDAAPDAPHADG